MDLSYPTAFIIGPPICKHCGQNASSMANGPAHMCEGLAKELSDARIQAAAKLLISEGWTLKPPNSDVSFYGIS